MKIAKEAIVDIYKITRYKTPGFCFSTLEIKWDGGRLPPCETVEEEVHVAKSLRPLSRIVCKWKNVAQLKEKALTHKF